MKRVSLILVLISISILTFAQKKEVTSAWNYLKDGLLADAKKSIDKAEINPQTSEWFRTYYYKGQIYHELGITDNKKFQGLCGDKCLDIAYDAYLKSIRLNFVKDEHRAIDLNTKVGFMQFVKVITSNDERNYEDTQSLYDIILSKFPALSNAFINNGVDDFQKQNFSEAYSKFEKAMDISRLSLKVDTQLMYFASLAAIRADKIDEAIELNNELIGYNYGANDDERVGIYLSQSQAYAQKGDTVKMLNILDKGIQKFPNSNYPLVIATFNYYVNKGESEKAFEYINLAIDKNPNDPQFFVIKGTLLEEMKRRDEAMLAYEKALNLDSKNFDANYNMGAFYYNGAVDTLKWAEENIPISDFAKMDEYVKLADGMFEKSVPYLEAAYSIQPKNANVINTLMTIYYRIKKMDEFEKMKAELDALKEE